MTKEQIQDKCRGSLVGGAVGDALGYEVEFLGLVEIFKRFGIDGICDYVLDANGVAEFSDDTQMSLFTAEGLLNAVVVAGDNRGKWRSSIRAAYEAWYATQTLTVYAKDGSWLSHVRALWSERAPGLTCMSALHHISFGDGSPVYNDSKGCGGIMRVAPIGIYSAAHPDSLNLDEAGVLAGYAAEITHKHQMSTFSSMAMAMLVRECILHENVDRDTFKTIIIDRVFKSLGAKHKGKNELNDLFNLILKAMWLANSDKSDFEAIRELGQGWIAEETLAIAVFSVLRYIDDFERCVCCAVNHDGDSDSTGAVAGNIIGAILSYAAIPSKYLTNLELHDVLVSVADDLSGASDDKQMQERYVNHQPYNVNSLYLI